MVFFLLTVYNFLLKISFHFISMFFLPNSFYFRFSRIVKECYKRFRNGFGTNNYTTTHFRTTKLQRWNGVFWTFDNAFRFLFFCFNGRKQIKRKVLPFNGIYHYSISQVFDRVKILLITPCLLLHVILKLLFLFVTFIFSIEQLLIYSCSSLFTVIHSYSLSSTCSSTNRSFVRSFIHSFIHSFINQSINQLIN